LEAGKPIKESQLATQLKVSRTPLREALLQLEQEGFIRSDERRGFSVERLSAREVREIYPVIWTLEGLALLSSAVCAHLLVPELARINAEFAKARNLQRAGWNEQLTSQSQNLTVARTISALHVVMKRFIWLTLDSFRALKEHDIVAAIKGLEKNWRFAMEVLIRKMGEE
jgi:DNA-binding GntR family transcriptional regulator